MAQIDSYLKRLVAENELNYLDDFLDLYLYLLVKAEVPAIL